MTPDVSTPSVLSYERARNIVREEHGGMTYVYVSNHQDFERVLNYEQAERDRDYRRGLYAQHAAEAYAGGAQ